MTDRLYIDGVDVFKAYGICVGLGGYKHLVQYPALKEVKCVDWPEENGVEPDLLNPVLAAKDNFSILISCQRYPVGFDAFCEFQGDRCYSDNQVQQHHESEICRNTCDNDDECLI